MTALSQTEMLSECATPKRGLAEESKHPYIFVTVAAAEILRVSGPGRGDRASSARDDN
jgi:hypothetical protein